MSRADLEEAAGQLRAAESTASPCSPLRERYPALDVAGAYEVQNINTQRAMSSGRRPVGRKIGLTSLAMQKQLGVDQPDFGILFSDMCYCDGEEIPWSRVLQPRVEAEISFVLAGDLDREQLSVLDLIGAIDYVLPAIEVVGSRIENWNIRIVDTIADNASSGAFVLGTVPMRLDDFDPRLCGMVLERSGEPVSVGAGAACLGNPLNAALWLARKMVTLGTPLRAGDVLLSGALGPMVPVASGDVIEARISGLGSVRAVFDRQSWVST